MRRLGILLVFALLVALGLIAGALWLHARPSWLLTVSNTSTGFAAIITTTASADPVYAVHVEGRSVKKPCTAARRTETVAPDVQTLFFDETVLPGRWTVDLSGVKLDIMEARIIVDDRFECGPGESVVVKADNH